MLGIINIYSASSIVIISQVDRNSNPTLWRNSYPQTVEDRVPAAVFPAAVFLHRLSALYEVKAQPKAKKKRK